MNCPLCNAQNEDIIFENTLFRIVLVDEIPGYIRVITQKHIKEFSELSNDEAVEIMTAVKKQKKQ